MVVKLFPACNITSLNKDESNSRPYENYYRTITRDISAIPIIKTVIEYPIYSQQEYTSKFNPDMLTMGIWKKSISTM